MIIDRNGPQLACLRCKEPLRADSDKVHCSACGSQWPIRNGIVSFIDTDFFWAECGFTKQALREINDRLGNEYWKDVLKSHEVPAIRQHSAFIENLERARWHRLLDLKSDAVVLDLGAGMGTISHSLSKHYNTVYAVEPVQERIEFSNSRFKQEQCGNVVSIRSDIDHLPFPEETFDLIVVNGILEWLPFNKKDINPRKAQLQYLEQLRTLLKQDGYVYIGIENRCSYNLFLGASDPHIPLKYVTVLPRLLAHLICQIKTKDIYRPYLYSYYGYRRLLKQVGFNDIRIYSALPSYNDPKYLIDMNESSLKFKDLIMTSRKKTARVAQKILIKTNLLKYLGYSYAIAAKR